MDLLFQLQQIPGPSGDEGPVADCVEALAAAIPGTRVSRYGDLVLAVRGHPRVAVFAHLDTVGFTQAHGRVLHPIGGPHVEGGERVREVGGAGEARIQLREEDERVVWRLSGRRGGVGSRWVYAGPLVVRRDTVTGPYLDNRAGVWNAVRTLERCEDVAVVFTPGEEHSGRGAFLGARLVYQELQITRALISDITWHTESIRNGRGPAISFRDSHIPRRRFLDQVVAAAVASGVPFQREVERSGGSDGAAIERSGFPLDWVFIGAPQKHSHTAREVCHVADLRAMADLYAHLVPALSR